MNRRVIIVDDNRDLADSLALMLEEEGCQVTVCYTGKEALVAFYSQRYDTAFIDIKLPDADGLKLFQVLHEEYPDTSVFMMTGYRVIQLLSRWLGRECVPTINYPKLRSQLATVIKQAKDSDVYLLTDEQGDFVSSGVTELRAQGINIVVANNEEEAVESVSQNPDVLAINMPFPILCAVSVYQQFQQEGIKLPIIIVMPAKDVGSISEILRSAEATNCIFKPFEPVQFLKLACGS